MKNTFIRNLAASPVRSNSLSPHFPAPLRLPMTSGRSATMEWKTSSECWKPRRRKKKTGSAAAERARSARQPASRFVVVCAISIRIELRSLS